MVKAIMGLKGSGKTKRMIELVSDAVRSEQGNIVYLEYERKLTYDIPSEARLLCASDYSFGSTDFLKGFISGLYAGNYDISHIFIDGIFKLAPLDGDMVKLEEMLAWLAKFGELNGIRFTVSISADADAATEAIRKYF